MAGGGLIPDGAVVVVLPPGCSPATAGFRGGGNCEEVAPDAEWLRARERPAACNAAICFAALAGSRVYDNPPLVPPKLSRGFAIWPSKSGLEAPLGSDILSCDAAVICC